MNSGGRGHDFWQQLPLGRGVSMLARDENGLAAFNKPADVLSHPNKQGDESRALLTVPYMMDGEVFQWPAANAPQRLWLLNRLDSATSGVILAAADEALAAEIREQFKRKAVTKVYRALVFGAPRESAEVWRDRLAVEKRGGQIRTAATGHVPAECRMSLVRLARGEPRLALLQLEPRTGRSHQLRVQCARRRLPIVGDQTYGDFPRNRAFAKATGNKRMFLHSFQTSFDYEFKGRRYRFSATAPLPAEFEQWL